MQDGRSRRRPNQTLQRTGRASRSLLIECVSGARPAVECRSVMRLRPPKRGARIRIVRLLPEWELPGYYVPRSTKSVYRKLIDRRRSFVISEICEHGLPWIAFRLRRRAGRMEYHWLVIDDGCWVRVKPRGGRPAPYPSAGMDRAGGTSPWFKSMVGAGPATR
jgi:hypothetical protein